MFPVTDQSGSGMFLYTACILYGLGLLSMPIYEGGLYGPTMILYCLAALSLGVHASRNAPHLAKGSRWLFHGFRLAPLILPATAVLVYQIAESL